MALMDLKSNLSWYGKPRRNTHPIHNWDDRDQTGFTVKRSELDPSEYTGINGELYSHTGVRQLGNLKFADWITNDHAKGFTGNMYPLGGDKKKSQFVGISGEEFNYNGLQEIGNIVKNIRSNTDDKIIGGPAAESKFIYNGDLTVSITPKGFSYDGTLVELQAERISKDSFLVDDLTMSDRGLAKRKAQGGTGHPFTNTEGFGPYKWKPKVHTGWHPDQKYSDTIKKNKTAGLADTYTDASPIDDLYNKLNLREDAHQIGYIKHPLILRGIQREGKTNNQRWGLGDTIAGQISSTLDLPRGGVLTSIERGVIDIARLAKFMVSPPGLAYMVKQLGQQLMNPNVEGKSGNVQKPFTKNSTKLWTPINTLLQPLAGIAGMHIKRHGLLPVDLPGGEKGSYGGVHKDRGHEGTYWKIDKETIKTNRLVRLSKKYKVGYMGKGSVFMTSPQIGQDDTMGTGANGILSGPTGPESFGGIGNTFINRWADTTLKTQLGDGEAKAGSAGYTWANYTTGYYHYGRPYQGIKDSPDSKILRGTAVDSVGTDGGESTHALNNMNLAYRVGTPDFEDSDLGSFHSFNIPGDNVIGQGNAQHPSTIRKKATDPQESVMGGEVAKNVSKLQAYTEIRKITKDRTPETAEIKDFRTIKTGKGITDYKTKDKKLTERGYPSFLPKADGSERTSQKDSFCDAYSQDLIKFRFNPIHLDVSEEGQGVIAFRAYIDSLDDSFTPQWNTTQDQGRSDSIFQYQSFERQISLSFRVPILSADERWIVMNKLKKLAQNTLPRHTSDTYIGQGIYVTIGDLYRKQAMIINDLTYSWDSETPWEITPGYQVPFVTSVDLSLTWWGNTTPSAGGNAPESKIFQYGD